jgi:hypothetical protein
VFDFDSKDDTEQARKDTVELVSRLISLGVARDQMLVSYSGSKGFSVELETVHSFTPTQLKNVAQNLATGLNTLDTKIYNASRVFRVPYTKHPATGLYKLPISIEQLSEFNMDQIKELAKNLDNAASPAVDGVELPQAILALANSAPEVTPIAEVGDIDYSKKERGMPSCKYRILNGDFPSGNRNNALMALGAHYKSKGVPKEVNYRILKGAAELQGRRYNQTPFDKTEIWNNIIEVLYGPHWKGATYSCADHDWLKAICPTGGKCSGKAKKEFVTIDSVSDIFSNYATNIDKNTIKTGIDTIDDSIRLQTHSHVVIAGSSGSGKCLGKGTLVLMYDGSTKVVEDVKVGDLLMGDDSTPRTVLSLARGSETLYKVSQEDGADYIVNESHILSLKCTNDQQHKATKTYIANRVVDISVKEYLNASGKFKECFKGYKAAVEFEEKSQPIPAYLMGYWLGNGSKSKPQVSMHAKDVEVLEYIKNYATAKGYKFNAARESENGVSVYFYGNKNEFVNTLRELELVNDKHVHRIYLTGSKAQRLDLIAGLLDSDGHYDPNKNTFEFTSSDERLMQQFQWLCRSVGYKCTYKRELKHYRSFTKGKLYEGDAVAYRAYLTGDRLDLIPNKLARKRAVAQIKQRYQDCTKISLENIGFGEYFGFEIDGNKRFVLGTDFTVTHNTSTILNILNNASKAGLKAVMGSMDMGAPLIYQKLAQKVSGLTDKRLYDIFKNKDQKRIKEIQQKIMEEYKNVFFDFRSGVEIGELRENLLAMKDQHGSDLKLVVYDFINRIRGPYSDETANLAYIAPKLSDLANETETLIISLAQIARSKGGPATPLTDSRIAKGSSAIEESATVLFGLWRPGYNKGDQDKYLRIAALKTRMGKEFSVGLGWDGMTGNIRSLSSEEEADLEILETKDTEKDGWGNF